MADPLISEERYSCTLHIGRVAEGLMKLTKQEEVSLMYVEEPRVSCVICGAPGAWRIR
jgi:hypothetical protein